MRTNGPGSVPSEPQNRLIAKIMTKLASANVPFELVNRLDCGPIRSPGNGRG